MAIYKKRIDDEDDEYEDESSYKDEKERRVRSRKIRDLNPENKKRRKEPPKPWGKKERLLVFIVLVITTGVSGILFLSSRAWKLPGFPRLKLPSVSLPFTGRETLVIEGNKERLELQKKKDAVLNSFNEKVKNLTGVYGLYVIDLNTGFSYGINENEEFEPASLIKLPVMVAMYIENEEGRLSLEVKYKLRNEDKVGGAGSLYSKPEGYEITYKDLIRIMGKQSDNTAFNIARYTLGEETINRTLEKIGMQNTRLSENKTTPEDIGRFFEELWNGNIIRDDHKDELLGYLTDTLYEEWIAAGVPVGVRVAHKFGREVNVVNDAGIVYSQKPFVIVLLSEGVVEKEADSIFPELTKLVYEVHTQN
jgi:beta-lactamase class A